MPLKTKQFLQCHWYKLNKSNKGKWEKRLLEKRLLKKGRRKRGLVGAGDGK